MPESLAVILATLVVVAGVYDLKWRRIPNWLTVCGLVSGLILNPWWMSLSGIGLALLVYLPFYLLRGMGAGDVKLMLAVGALAGATHWFLIFVITSLLGGAVAIAMVLWHGRLYETLANVGFIFSRLVRLRAPYREKEELDVRGTKGMRLPHGTVIAAATLLYLAFLRISG